MSDLQPYYQYAIAALAVIAALLVLVFVLRQLNGKGRGRRGHRLGIVEYHEIDQNRRLVLIRRDTVEHLVLIGGQHDLVVESGITGHPHLHPRADQSAHVSPKGDDMPPLRAPRAPVFGSAKKPVLQSAPSENPPRDDEPTPT